MDSKPFDFPKELHKSKLQRKTWTSYFKPEEKENPNVYRTTHSIGYATASPLTKQNEVEMRNDDLGEFFYDIYDNFSDISKIGPSWESYKF